MGWAPERQQRVVLVIFVALACGLLGGVWSGFHPLGCATRQRKGIATMLMKRLLATTALAAGLSFAAVDASAGPLLVGGGWIYDQVDGVGIPSQNSPWTFSFGAAGGYFSITDAFEITDDYTVTDSVLGLLITTAAGAIPAVWSTPSDPDADAAWANPAFSKGQVFLPGGDYELTIVLPSTDQSVPAGFYVRADELPVPAPAALAIFGLGLVGLGLVGRRKAA
jgi:hypothetical protein